MCGIAGGMGIPEGAVAQALAALAHRGPDGEGLRRHAGSGAVLGHRRLAIIDPTPASAQPFVAGGITLAYNGECWNYRALRAGLEDAGVSFRTAGDTEAVARALERWGPAALSRLDAMFALAWWDADGTLFLARDRFGEVPLHTGRDRAGRFVFASERKALRILGAHPGTWRDVGPGQRVAVAPDGTATVTRYYDPPATPEATTRERAARELAGLLDDAGRLRRIADVPVCTLLSGGIDSAGVAAVLSRYLPGLVAYTAVLDTPEGRRSPDLRAARTVAEALALRLEEVAVPVPSAENLAAVVRAVELPQKAQVEIGWPCLVLARRIRADGFRVTYSGEGSDELWASYQFAARVLAGASPPDWHAYRKVLFLRQARVNFPRANKAFLSAGVECRLPFLHPPLVEYALSLPRAVVQDGPRRPKAVLQDALRGSLPPAIIGRPKLALQDAMGLKARIAGVLASPERFYRAEYVRAFGPLSGSRAQLPDGAHAAGAAAASAGGGSR